MPLPLIPVVLGAAAGAAALVGAKKGYDAYSNNKEAENVNDKANRIIDDAKNKVELARKLSYKALENLGRQKIYVLDSSIKRFIAEFEKLKNIELAESSGLDEINKLRLDKAQFEELKSVSLEASSMIAGGVGGVGAGALAAFGAYGATMTFGAASTGTAIASLSGVAATNATLAFLGGGSLAAGGLGMAGGMAVLGAAVAGPAIAVMGFVANAAAEKKLEEARSNLAQARKIVEELENLCIATNAIRRRSQMFERLLIRTDCLFVEALDNMQRVIRESGVDYSGYDEDSKKVIAANIKLAETIKAILDTPILNEDGSLSEESGKFLESSEN